VESDGTAKDKLKMKQPAAAAQRMAVESSEPAQLALSQVKDAVRQWMTTCSSKSCVVVPFHIVIIQISVAKLGLLTLK